MKGYVKIMALLTLGTAVMAEARITPRSAGIGVRGTYRNSNRSNSVISYAQHHGEAKMETGEGGGWIYFFSRLNDQWNMEFSLGGVGRAETREHHYYGEDVEVDAVASALIGLRHDLFSIRNPSAMQPYLAFGGGPYWINEILVEDRAFGLDEEVTVKSKPKPGAYAGAGLNFMLSNWFGINFDVKYHFVDLNVNHDYSGWEYGFGVLVAWGRWVPSRR